MRAKKVKDILDEAKLGDFFVNNPEFAKKFSDESKKYEGEFKKDEPLIRSIGPEIKLIWNHNPEKHDMYKRIQNRTSFPSVSEFNQSVSELIFGFFHKYFTSIISQLITQGPFKIALYSREDEYHLLIIPNLENFKRLGKSEIMVVTLMGKNASLDADTKRLEI